MDVKIEGKVANGEGKGFGLTFIHNDMLAFCEGGNLLAGIDDVLEKQGKPITKIGDEISIRIKLS